MMWNDSQLKKYHEEGFLFCQGLFSKNEIDSINENIPSLLNGNDEEDKMYRVREKTGAVRSLFLAHRYQEQLKAMSRSSKILNPVSQIIGDELYIYHSKLNVKDAFEGTVWLWHQDYGYWMWDGVKPRLMSVMVFLDVATVNNGSLMVIKGSHKQGRLEHYADEKTTSYKQWCIDVPTLSTKIKEEDILHIIGKPGDVLFFDCNLIHGSGHNMSPLRRNTFIIVYNDLNNKPIGIEKPRPDWVVSREYEKLEPSDLMLSY